MEGGSFECNPPFCIRNCPVEDKLLSLLSRPVPMSFCLVYPSAHFNHRTSQGHHAFQYTRFCYEFEAGEHSYYEGRQHKDKTRRLREAANASTMVVLQNEAGFALYGQSLPKVNGAGRYETDGQLGGTSTCTVRSLTVLVGMDRRVVRAGMSWYEKG